MISTARRSLHVEAFKITADQLQEDKVIFSTISRYERYFERLGFHILDILGSLGN